MDEYAMFPERRNFRILTIPFSSIYPFFRALRALRASVLA